MSSVTETFQSRLGAVLHSRPSFHWFATLLMAAAVVPMFRLAGLPLRIDLVGMAWVYWWASAVRAVLVAISLAVLGLPWSQTLGPLIQHYRRQKLRLPFLGLLAVWLVHLFGWEFGLVLVIETVAVAELLDRGPELLGKRVMNVLIPAGYFFLGLLLVFALNHAIAGLEFAGTWDGFFNRWDGRIFGLTVSEAANWSKAHLPQWLWQVASLAYYDVYGQVGAALAIIALAAGGRREALRYVGIILTGYALALTIFYFMPSMGPFALRDAPPGAPAWLAETYFSQRVVPLRAQLLWKHAALPGGIQVQLADYYIGFPCMHVAMPAIALWFLRRWRRMAALLLAFDLLIILGIVLLEWHYFLDILGGVGAAAVAIALNPAPKEASCLDG